MGDTDIYGNGGSYAWVLKLNANGAVSGCANIGTSNATTADATASMENSPPVDEIQSIRAIGPLTSDNATAATFTQCYYDATPFAVTLLCPAPV